VDYLDPIFLVSLIGGMAILFFGRKLFWVYVGLLGFLVGFELIREYFPQQPQWFALVAGLALGVILAMLAMAMQYIAIGLAGFLGGAYLSVQILTILPIADSTQLQNWVPLIGGALGALLCMVVFEPALIVLSSLLGAAVLAQLAPIDSTLQAILMLLLALAGMGYQFKEYRGVQAP